MGGGITDNREKILNALKSSSMGLTTTELQSKTGLSYPTMLKWLEVLRVEGLADYRTIGKSRLWFASETLKSMEKPLLNKLLVQRILTSSFEQFKEQLVSKAPGVIDLLDSRHALMGSWALSKMVSMYLNSFGYKKGSEVLYRLGKELGGTYVQFWSERFEGAGKELLRVHLSLLSLTGWGQGKLVHCKPEEGKCTIRIYNHPVSMPEFGKPIHFLEAGMFAELMSHIAGKRVKVSEVKCTSAGANFCEFRSKFR